ncbi:hypothetical protein ON010_g12954 [Phytophthora cinnamomi]|nr:hypothetical protein ON010_g12954 [Phytophthora cinnamomi]
MSDAVSKGKLLWMMEKDERERNGDERSGLQRAEDKCVYWEAQVDWWTRWASEHDLSLNAASSASVHLSFMQEMATQAAEEHRGARGTQVAKKSTMSPRGSKKSLLHAVESKAKNNEAEATSSSCILRRCTLNLLLHELCAVLLDPKGVKH